MQDVTYVTCGFDTQCCSFHSQSPVNERLLFRSMTKHVLYIGKNKDADRLCSNCTADQRLCFCFTDSKIPTS